MKTYAYGRWDKRTFQVKSWMLDAFKYATHIFRDCQVASYSFPDLLCNWECNDPKNGFLPPKQSACGCILYRSLRNLIDILCDIITTLHYQLTWSMLPISANRMAGHQPTCTWDYMCQLVFIKRVWKPEMRGNWEKKNLGLIMYNRQ